MSSMPVSRRRDGAPWTDFSQDPRRPESAPIRASDQDRDVVLGVLGEAYAEGRLTREEFDERSETTTRSRTLGDLPALLADLVPAGGRRARVDLHAEAVRHWEHERRQALLGIFLGPSLICWVIWVFTSVDGAAFHPYFPWPVFVSLGGLVRLVQLHVNRQDEIAERQAKLEKRELKALQAARQR